MNPVEIIVKKRDGLALSAEEINDFVRGFTSGEIPDYQLAAFAMAVYFRGMTPQETTDLTLAMASSGAQLDLHDAVAPGAIIVDKHSSGGVGDKTTLAVGPIVAACGLPVGKMSGRGLSFSGGTIDKLESIQGWSPDLREDAFRRQLRAIGLVVAGQTADLAPADRQLYALRDVTGTVPSLPLIASSIMSKKLAAGADAIVLDVKCGKGAFMATRDDARALALLMVEIGRRAGRSVTALVTQMDEPLGNAVGNALEVAEAIATLHGRGPADFQELVELVSGEMLRLGSKPPMDRETAQQRIRHAINSGAALDKLRAFVTAQGGDSRQVDDPTLLPAAPIQTTVVADGPGYVRDIDARAVGLAVVDLGGGRQRKEDAVDHAVGVVLHVKVGAHVAPGQPLFTVHAAADGACEHAAGHIRSAFSIGDEPVDPLPILLDRIESDDTAVMG